MATSVFCFLGLIIYIVNGQQIDDWYSHFEFNTFIDEDEIFQVFWTPNQDNCKIEIGLAVETNSYVAFGISESGGMAGSDIVIGWITPDDEYILQNRYTLGYQPPSKFDSQQGITKKEGWKTFINGTYTTYLHFEKELFPDFDINIVNIKIGTTRVIFAFGNDENEMYANSEPTRHCDDCKGPQSMNLLQGESIEIPLPDDYQTYDVVIDEYTVPSTDTTYYCSLHQLPYYPDKQHVVRIDPIINPPENQAVVHHQLLYYCPESMVNKTDVGKGWICHEMGNMPQSECLQGYIIAGWAIGGNDFYFPEDVGLEITGNDEDAIQYVLLQTHYDNYKEEIGRTDMSGLRLYYTPTLRDLSASLLMVGIKLGIYQFIPPGIEAALNLGYCFSDCITNGIPEEGVHVFANILHMHELGRKQILRHIRDGKELRPLDMNQAYDFDYQQFTSITDEVTILPGDQLIVECTLDSTGRDYVTFGGESSREEMCISFIYVYPKTDLSKCISQFLDGDLSRFLLEGEELGYVSNITYNEVTGQIIDFNYDVTVNGSLEFYNSFQIGDIYEPAERQQTCMDTVGNPINGNFGRYNVLKPGDDYKEYNLDNYYECKSDESAFDWDVWYVYLIAAFIGIAVLLLLLYLIRKITFKRKENSYHRILGKQQQTDAADYGTNSQSRSDKQVVSMQERL